MNNSIVWVVTNEYGEREYYSSEVKAFERLIELYLNYIKQDGDTVSCEYVKNDLMSLIEERTLDDISMFPVEVFN